MISKRELKRRVDSLVRDIEKGRFADRHRIFMRHYRYKGAKTKELLAKTYKEKYGGFPDGK